MSNTNDDTTPTTTNTTDSITVTETIPKITDTTNELPPPEIPTTITVTNTDTSNEIDTTKTAPSSYGPVTGQSQTVTASRFNPIKATTPTTSNTNSAVTESKTESKQDDTLIQQQLLNQYAFYTPNNNALNTAAAAQLTTANPLGNALGVGALGGTGVGIGNALGVSNALGGTAAAQQYLLYNQLAAQATASYNNINNSALLNPLLRAQLMAQRAAQLQTLTTNSQKWVLFVFHLPEDMDDNGLLLLFSPFGATQAIVMRHKNTDCSRGFGFVHFRTKNDAQIAIDMMNGYQIGHKRLRVSFKKSKE